MRFSKWNRIVGDEVNYENNNIHLFITIFFYLLRYAKNYSIISIMVMNLYLYVCIFFKLWQFRDEMRGSEFDDSYGNRFNLV